ncbi:MAG: cupin domain-containing protein [Oscillospiraceae bacterium]|nr:cupin domain-containing protein [Oscillospiraceae bacterium]
MSKNPYMVRIAHPEDCVAVHGAGNQQEVRDISLPVNPNIRHEITCMMFKTPGEEWNVGYHQHGNGLEFFLPTSGKIEIIAQGQITYMVPGDIFVILPFMSHGFRTLEPDSAFMCLFQGFDMIQSVEKRAFIAMNFPGKFESEPEFLEYYNKDTKGKMDRKVPNPIPTDRDQVFCLRQQGKGLFSYNYPGVDLHLKVGRWETEGLMELWEADLKKGAKLSQEALRKEWRQFYIYKGNVKVKIHDEEFIVDEPAIINVPPFRPFSFEALDDAVIFDLDCPAMLHALLEEMGDPAKKHWEEDPARVEYILDKYNSYMQFEYKPE